LSTDEMAEESVKEWIEDFVGWKWFAAKILYAELRPGAAPLSHDNILVLATGPRKGTHGSRFSNRPEEQSFTGLSVSNYNNRFTELLNLAFFS
jgi:hypothetical protein